MVGYLRFIGLSTSRFRFLSGGIGVGEDNNSARVTIHYVIFLLPSCKSTQDKERKTQASMPTSSTPPPTSPTASPSPQRNRSSRNAITPFGLTAPQTASTRHCSFCQALMPLLCRRPDTP